MTNRTVCSVPNCDRPSKKRGWCDGHYVRWWSTGDLREDVPLRIHGDNTARLLTKFDRRGDDECWPWKKPGTNGYGYFLLDGREIPAHRATYEHFVGPIPDGLVIDHLCRNPPCVNPAHLEPVTHAENVRRGRASEAARDRHARRTHCKRGHEFSEENTYRHPRGYRSCRACQRERERKLRELQPKKKRQLKTHCKRGHAFDHENTYVFIRSNGNIARNCRACMRIRSRDAAKN